VRPDGIHGMTPKSVRKKLKQPSFAAAVNRDDITRGAEQLGVELNSLIESIVSALDPLAQPLGIDGGAAAGGAGADEGGGA
jgi:predicted hydrolase (HD superfamily)